MSKSTASMSNITLASLMTVIILSVISISSAAVVSRHLGCYPCTPDTCPDDEKECIYGYYIDCGNKVCKKGPGETCGGVYNLHGICGSGLLCSCNRCKGCSVRTLECTSNEYEPCHNNNYNK